MIITLNSACYASSENEIINGLPLKPQLSDKELLALYKYSTDVNTILEFGMGGSTFLFSAIDKVVYSFDTDLNYIKNIKNHDLLKFRANKKHFFFHFDVGEVGNWGMPLKPEEQNFFTSIGKYLLAIDLSKIDLFFIDGRYRVESALSLFANSRDDSVFIIHDFTNRNFYHELLDYFDAIESIDTLVILKKKTNIDYTKLYEALIKYQQDYR